MTARETIAQALHRIYAVPDQADAILRALNEAGYAVVPKEATPEMIGAANRIENWSYALVYRAMIAAAEEEQ